jgi:hypothetical protein
MRPLTATQRKALHLAARKGGNELGNAKGQIRRQTANLLALKEWVTIVNGVALITKAGRAELLKPIPEGPPIFCAKGGGIKYKTLPSGRQVEDKDGAETLSDHGYTTNRGRASDDLEVLPIPPRRDWLEHSAKLHLASRRDADAMRLSGLTHPEDRVVELRRMAVERGKDIRGDLRQLEHVVKRIERKVSEEAA